MPLCPGVQNPEDGFENRSGGDRLAPRSIRRDIVSSGKCLRMRSHCSSVKRIMKATVHTLKPFINFEIGSRNCLIFQRRGLLIDQAALPAFLEAVDFRLPLRNLNKSLIYGATGESGQNNAY